MRALPVAGHWFEKRTVSDDISLIYEPHVVPLLRCNIWHVRGRDRDLMIDTGMGVCSLKAFVSSFLQNPLTAVATHAHVDHIGSHHEFDDCVAHPLEADGIAHPNGKANLIDKNFDASNIATCLLPPIEGYDVSGPIVTALPSKDYDLRDYCLTAARAVSPIVEGDVMDLGSRAFEVLHLPGHSPGGIGLWEARTGTLFSGDAIYDGRLLDNLHHSNIEQYACTMRRLMELPVQQVHAGHDPSFGRERLKEIALSYLRRWDA